MHHDNAPAHTLYTVEMLYELCFNCYPPPPQHSPDLTTSDFVFEFEEMACWKWHFKCGDNH